MHIPGSHNKKMTIDVFSMLYNEERIIRHMIEYYQFAHITFIDSYSTDRSLSICSEYKNVTIKEIDTGNKLNDKTHREIKNNCWKESKADWVIVIDTDEFIYHPQLLDKLQELKENNYTIIKPIGYMMVSEFLPAGNIIDNCRYGYFEGWFSKPCIFNPQKITEINFKEGGHQAYPRGDVNVYGEKPDIINLKEPGLNTNDIKLLHYHYVDWRSLLNKQPEKRNRSVENIKNGYGDHWGWSDEFLKKQILELSLKVKQIIR